MSGAPPRRAPVSKVFTIQREPHHFYPPCTLGGDATISEGGTAVRITGDDADLQASNIDATATGAGSSLVSITGDDANANLSGTLTVRDGARGLDISGDRATVQSAARIDVADGRRVNGPACRSPETTTRSISMAASGCGSRTSTPNMLLSPQPASP